MCYLQDPAGTDEAIAVALGGADYDWNRWAGYPQPPHPHLDPSKTIKHRTNRQKKHSRQRQEQQQAVSPQDLTVGLPVGNAAKVEAEEEGLPGHERNGRVPLHGSLSADIHTPVLRCVVQIERSWF